MSGGCPGSPHVRGHVKDLPFHPFAASSASGLARSR